MRNTANQKVGKLLHILWYATGCIKHYNVASQHCKIELARQVV